MRGWITLAIILVIVVCPGGVLLGLILQIREAALAMQCMNNLKQIGMAVDCYCDCHDRYPSATMTSPTLAPDRRLSWMPDILPYTEGMSGQLLLDPEKAWDVEPNREPLLESSDKNRPTNAEASRATRYGPIPLFLCPANSDRGRAGLPPFTHYVGVGGVGPDAAGLPENDSHVGFFGYDRVTRKADVKDGLGYTILVAETATDNGPWTAGGYPTVRGPDPGKRPHLSRSAPFSSRHGDKYRDLVGVVLGDGSVRHIGPWMSPPVFEAGCTIRGNESLPSDWWSP